jgi:MFS family permease
MKEYFRSMSFTPRVAGWRDVYLASTARGVSYLGDFLAATALVLALQGRGAGGFAVAAVLVAAAVPPVLLARVAGRLVDRFDSRTLLVCVGLAQAACCAGMAFVHEPWLLVALVGLLAAGLAVTQPTFQALLPDMVDRAGLPRALAIGQTMTSVGALAGPALAGVLVGAYGLRVPLLVDAATYLAVVVAGLFLRTRRRGAAEAPGTTGAPAWRLGRDPLIGLVVVMLGFLILAVNVEHVAGVFFVRGTLGGSAFSYGLLEAVWAGTMLLGGWLGAVRTPDDTSLGRRMAFLSATTAAAIALAGLMPAVGWLFPLWALGGTANGLENSALGVLGSRRVPAAVRGQVFARLGAVVNAANIVGYLLGGVLVERFAPGLVITAGGVVGLFVALGFAVPLWRAAARPAPTPGLAVAA